MSARKNPASPGSAPFGADVVGGSVDDPFAGEDLLAERHGAGPRVACGRFAQRARRRERHLASHAGHVELEQATVRDDLPGDLVRPRRELGQRDRLARADAVDESEIGRGEDAQVLAVLVVDALDALADDDLDPGHQLGVRALLAARPLAAALAGDGTDEAGVLDAAALDGGLGAAFSTAGSPAGTPAGTPVLTPDLQPQVREFAQRLVVEEADVRGGDLVGADLVAEAGLQVGREVEVEPFVELAADQVGIVREEKDAPAEGDLRRAFPDLRPRQLKSVPRITK